jgi:histidyl-tRNA synthetase
LRDEVSAAARRHHDAVLAMLDAAGVPVRDDPRLGFGATRYRRTILELRALEGDDTRMVVARGGRRDNLVAAVGGPQTPAVGLTLGLMRAAACVAPADASFEPGCEIFFAAQGARSRAWAFRAAAAERARGFRVDVDLGDGSWDEQLARADELHARVVVLCGEDERQSGEVQLRDLRSQKASSVREADLSSALKRLLR